MKKSLLGLLFIFITTMPALAQGLPGSNGNAAEPPWGREIESRSCLAKTILAICPVEGEPVSAHPIFSRTLVIGPSLWRELVAWAPGIATIGTARTLLPKGINKRAAGRVLRSEEISEVFGKRACRDYLVGFCNADFSAATASQRRRCYELGARGIRTRPITVSSVGSNVLLILLDRAGKIRMLELLRNDHQSNPIVVEFIQWAIDKEGTHIKYQVKNVSNADYWIWEKTSPEKWKEGIGCNLTFGSAWPANTVHYKDLMRHIKLLRAHSKRVVTVLYRDPLPESCKKEDLRIQLSFFGTRDIRTAGRLKDAAAYAFLRRKERIAETGAPEGLQIR